VAPHKADRNKAIIVMDSYDLVPQKSDRHVRVAVQARPQHGFVALLHADVGIAIPRNDGLIGGGASAAGKKDRRAQRQLNGRGLLRYSIILWLNISFLATVGMTASQKPMNIQTACKIPYRGPPLAACLQMTG